MSVTLMRDRAYLAHEPGWGHPERPDRLRAIDQAIAGAGLVVTDLAAEAAAKEDLERVHSAEHVANVQRSAGLAAMFDADTRTSPGSVEAALKAAGGTLRLLEHVAAARTPGFALVRPPGHHAVRESAMGFCLFNNVAVAAAYARVRLGLQRVAIVDFDVHHGNGTEAIFAEDRSVLYVSSHQYPFYPGTGAAVDVGRGKGSGYTVNLPLPSGATDADALAVYDELALPILEQFAPELVLVSAGFDAHRKDPLGGLMWTEAAYAGLSARLLQLAEKHAGGRILYVLEGGYDLGALGSSVVACLRVLDGEAAAAPASSQPVRAGDAIAATRAAHKRYWGV